jgi:uncharacterized membrane protein YtjA (UPF0391 family)
LTVAAVKRRCNAAWRSTFYPSNPDDLVRLWKDQIMLGWTLVFAILALIAGALGFVGLAGFAASVAKLLFFIFLILLVISFIMRAIRGNSVV